MIILFHVYYRAESGFNHVEPEKYEPRLLHFKGLRVCHVCWFECTTDSTVMLNALVLCLDLTQRD